MNTILDNPPFGMLLEYGLARVQRNRDDEEQKRPDGSGGLRYLGYAIYAVNADLSSAVQITALNALLALGHAIMADYLKIAQLALARTTVALVSTAHLPGTAAGNADDIEVAPYLPDCGFAIAVLDRARVRIMLLDGATIGVWSDLDGPEVRRALKAVGIGHLGTSMAPVLRSGTNVARWRVNLFRS